ncbi:MAG: trimeric intracellular cation channel family protein [Lachnospiraceae bacterium]|nr:trimeric intracellular cation channel family protein [Lachnospiraceae bacterium]
MPYSELFIFLLEIVGTIAFASSGAMLGIRKNMDIFGVNVLGITTAVGGGCVRDLLLGIHPPKMFQNFAYVGTAILTSCLLFVVFFIKKELLESTFLEHYERVMSALDAVGLGIFTVMGIRTAMDLEGSHFDHWFLLVFVGVATGIGGGMMRDVMAGETPFVFIKHVYACAALIGAFLYIFLCRAVPDIGAMLVSSITVVAVRLLAAHYRWNLPRIR